MSRTTPLAGLAAILSGTLALGCQGAPPRQANVPVSATGPEPLSGAETDGEAQRLVVGAVSCWMGGLWADAVGDTPDARAWGELPAPRTQGIERRCRTLLVHVYGTATSMQYAQLRAVEPLLVNDLVMRVRTIAGNDRGDRAHVGELVGLLRAVAAAERENVQARVKADNVKRNLRQPSTAAERATDKRLAAEALGHTRAIEALLTPDVGDLSRTAHAVGLLCALDRLEIARGLPKHLKVLAVGGPFARVFGVPPPEVPADPTQPIRTGTWPGYLADVAAASGHLVPPEATEPIDRASLAWGGVLQAFADRLREDAAHVPPRTPLPDVLSSVAARLEQQNRRLVSLFWAEQRGAQRAARRASR